MKTHQIRCTGLLLACAGLFATPVLAQVQSDVTASNLRVVLVDLTPGDGETPWFTFTQTDLSPLSASSAVTPAVGLEQRALDRAERSGFFTFSPNTRVSLALDVDIAMQAMPLSQPEQGGTVWAYLLAKATWGPPRDIWERRDSEDVYGDVGLYGGSFRSVYDRNETLWVTFDNETAYAATGEFTVQLESSSYALASAVPEASAPAMLFLGAGLLGLLGRRRPRAHRAGWA
jgi:hypothetical protein